MKVYRSLADINIDFETSVALGNFDGVHIGHQKILKSAVKLAAKLGVRQLVLHFQIIHASYLGRLVVAYSLLLMMMKSCSFLKTQELK